MSVLEWLTGAADELLAIDLELPEREPQKQRFGWCVDCDSAGVVTAQSCCERCGSESVLHVRAGREAA